MSDKGRSSSKLAVYALALPVFAVVYMTTFGGRLWAVVRPAVATFLGITVISSVYAEEAYKRAPATPMRAAATLALAVALVAPAVSPAPVNAADPVEAVIAAAREYIGQDFQLGAEGPKQFDCSGLVYRAFLDAGELPRIGGMRLRARGYMQYFVSRGRFTKDVAEAERGDLVIYDNGSHIGIYLGDGKVLSALVNPWGVSVHSLHGIHLRVSYFLHINWGGGDANDPGNPTTGKHNNGKNNGGNNNGKGNKGNTGNGPGDTDNNNNNGKPDKNPPDSNTPDVAPTVESVRPNGFNATALGTMNMRVAADPSARIIGWVGRNASFKIVDQGNSPAGYMWFQVKTLAGKTGWVYSRWVKQLGD